jgi:hypothetical protein
MLFAYPGVDREAGGISADADHTRTVLAIIYSDNLELSEQNVRSAGASITKPIFSFLAADNSTSPTPVETNWRSSRISSPNRAASQGRKHSAVVCW